MAEASFARVPPAGVREKLGHFQYLNIKSVWLSTFYRSSTKAAGYGVEDFRAVDPLFGTMQDFDDLLAEMHKLGDSLAAKLTAVAGHAYAWRDVTVSAPAQV